MTQWNPGPGPFEPFPDGRAVLVNALRQLQESARQAAVGLHQLQMRVMLLSLDLDDWNDEMDNCYPNWPDTPTP